MDGTPFGRYRLVKLLGRGSIGEVWRAHDTDTDRIVAIKVLRADVSEDEDFQRRFRRDVRAAARLNNPHVIPIHHYGEIDGRLYIDMRLIQGRDLKTVLAAGPLDPGRAVRIIGQVANALLAAHQVGLLHGDIKPSNILLGRDGFAYLVDFGIARAADKTRMAKSGNMIGTSAHIGPRRLDPRIAEDARADIYSLVCVLYESLTGQPPFPGGSMAYRVAAQRNTGPPRPSTTQPEVLPQVGEVIATGMVNGPNQRDASTIELADGGNDAITVPIARPVPTPPQRPAGPTPRPVPAPAVAKYHRPQPPRSPWAPEAAVYSAEPFATPVTDFGQPLELVPTPRPQRRAGLIAAIVATMLVLVSGVLGITGYLVLRHPRASQTPTAPPAPPSSPTSSTPQPAPAPPNALKGLLLSVEQINTAMGTTGMRSVGIMTTMPDNSFAVSDLACLPLSAAVQAKVYADSAYSAMRAQVVAKAQQSAVDQAVVLFSSAQDAGSFFTASAQSWGACANRQFTLAMKGNSQVQTVGPVSNANGTLSATVTPANSPGICERALTVANNIAVDVTACGGPSGTAVSIAHQIAAKVP